MFIIPSIFIIIEIHLVFYKEQYLCSSLYLSQYNFFNFDDINCCLKKKEKMCISSELRFRIENKKNINCIIHMPYLSSYYFFNRYKSIKLTALFCKTTN